MRRLKLNAIVKTLWDPQGILQEPTTSTRILRYLRVKNVGLLYLTSMIVYNSDCLTFHISPHLQGTSIILSDLGVGIMGCFLFYMGRNFFLWYYLIPYLVSYGFNEGFVN
jgi:hypothetical protein